MSHSAVRTLFVLLILSTVLSYAFAQRFGEPYPAIRMPGFSDVPVRNGEIRVQVVRISVLFPDRASATVSQGELLAPLPGSHRAAVLLNVFRRKDTGQDWETAEWVKGRISHLFPNRRAKGVRFEWFEDTLAERTGWKLTSHELTATHEVEF